MSKSYKIKGLIRDLQRLEKKHGNVRVVFDNRSVIAEIPVGEALSNISLTPAIAIKNDNKGGHLEVVSIRSGINE